MILYSKVKECGQWLVAFKLNMKVADLCNYATRDNNAELLQATSENLHGEAVNVLDPLRKVPSS